MSLAASNPLMLNEPVPRSIVQVQDAEHRVYSTDRVYLFIYYVGTYLFTDCLNKMDHLLDRARQMLSWITEAVLG